MKNRKYRIEKRELAYIEIIMYHVQIKFGWFGSWIDCGPPYKTLEGARGLIKRTRNPIELYEVKEVFDEE